MPFLAISLFISVCCFRNESVGYLVDNAKEDAAKKALKQIYMGENDEEYQDRYDELAKNAGTHKDDEAKEGGSYEPPMNEYEGGGDDEA